MDVGARIKFFREKRGITVNRLANLSGISQSYLRDVELDKKDPTVGYLEYICFGLGITLKDFFDTDDEQTAIPDELDRLTPRQRELLTEFIRSL